MAMEVPQFYNDDNLVNYDQQSSPSSVGSAGSTDIGNVSAIGQPYGGVNFNKEAVLKSMNLNFTQKQHLKPIENTVIASHTSGGHHHSIVNGNTLQRVNGAPVHQGVITNAYGTLSSGYALASPDVNMLKLGSPDLERLIGHNPHMHGNGQYLQKQENNIGVTHEQEMYAQGFERELERLKSRSGSNPDISASGVHSAANSGPASSQCSVITTGISQQHMNRQQPYMHEQYYQPTSVSASSGAGQNQLAGGTIHHMSNPLLTHLKEEPPQTVPVMSHTPPLSPINMAAQEAIKSERKRQRNRVAASKCRKRKLERISRLEDKVKSLKTQNMELSANANLLRQQVAELKSKVMAHVNSGCQLMMSQQQVNF